MRVERFIKGKRVTKKEISKIKIDISSIKASKEIKK
jgi:hypothetical protein